MDRYELSTQIGDGSFGRVMKATSKETGEVVAIKHIKRKFKTWKACIDLREVQSLRMTQGHCNIVKMMEVIREEDESLYFVFEYLPDGTLYDLMKNSVTAKMFTQTSQNQCKSILSHQTIVSIMKQVLSGLAFMNSKGLFHRDIKPENLLVDLSKYSTHDGRGIVIKVADFGLARSISTPPYTYYVSTRWYRAPEVLIHAPHYGPAVDLFACGLILWELYTLRPLFPGTNEIDQIHKIAGLLGSPEQNWVEGLHLMSKLNMRLVNAEHIENDVIEEKICRDIRGEKAAANLICRLIQWNPEVRPSSNEALVHEYFENAAEHQSVTVRSTLRAATVDSQRESVNSRLINAKSIQRPGEFNRGTIRRSRSLNNDENLCQMTDAIVNVASNTKTWKENNDTDPFETNRSSVEQPNEFCEYLDAITSDGASMYKEESRGGQTQSIGANTSTVVAPSVQQNSSRFDPLQRKFTSSARYRPRIMLTNSRQA